MKQFKVTVKAPSVADIFVAAEGEKEAIMKAKNQIDAGAKVLEFTPVFFKSFDADEYFAREIRQDPQTGLPDIVEPLLKRFTVRLKATSVKEVPVEAVSPEAAEELVRAMYFKTDVLDFTDADVQQVKVTVENTDEIENFAQVQEFLDALMNLGKDEATMDADDIQEDLAILGFVD